MTLTCLIVAVSLILSSGSLELVIEAGCSPVLFCSRVSKANLVCLVEFILSFHCLEAGVCGGSLDALF